MTSTFGPIACAAIAFALAAPGAAKPRDPLYQWTDAAGVVRYTTEAERIPADLRGAAVVVAGANAAAPVERSTAPSAAQPEAARAPAPEPAPQPASEDPAIAALDARIAELEKTIAADEAVLADYISDPERTKREADSPDVAAIADRLPKLQKELRELRAQRDAAAGAPAAPNAGP